MANKEEYPPLLDIGFHPKTLAELRILCVDGFNGKSNTRHEVMCGLEEVVEKLIEKSIVGNIWVDGSFVTQKNDPNDVDMLLAIDGNFYDNCSVEQRNIIDWVGSNLKVSHKCDSYAYMFYDDPAHPQYWDSVWHKSYWLTRWGWYREDGPNVSEVKGLALLSISGIT